MKQFLSPGDTPGSAPRASSAGTRRAVWAARQALSAARRAITPPLLAALLLAALGLGLAPAAARGQFGGDNGGGPRPALDAPASESEHELDGDAYGDGEESWDEDWSDGQVAATPEESRQAARQALTGERFPWYDSEKDELRRFDLAIVDTAASDRRDSQWVVQPQANRPARPGGAFGTWFMEPLFWIVVAAVVVALVVILAWAFLRREAGDEEAAVVGSRTSREADRIEQLPFQVKRPQDDLLSAARRHYEAGDYNEAIIYFYSFLLVQLDKHQLLRLAKGKTNRQYLVETQSRQEIAPLLESTMLAFEDVFFGKHSLDRARFEECWSGLDEFQRHLRAGANA